MLTSRRIRRCVPPHWLAGDNGSAPAAKERRTTRVKRGRNVQTRKRTDGLKHWNVYWRRNGGGKRRKWRTQMRCGSWEFEMQKRDCYREKGSWTSSQYVSSIWPSLITNIVLFLFSPARYEIVQIRSRYVWPAKLEAHDICSIDRTNFRTWIALPRHRYGYWKGSNTTIILDLRGVHVCRWSHSYAVPIAYTLSFKYHERSWRCHRRTAQ